MGGADATNTYLGESWDAVYASSLVPDGRAIRPIAIGLRGTDLRAFPRRQGAIQAAMAQALAPTRHITMAQSQIRFGMIGGGEGAFIGAVHRTAARIAGNLRLVCAVLSSDPAKNRRSNESLLSEPTRSYANFEAMYRAEAALPEDSRMQFVAIAAPNHVHFPAAAAALKSGFHVLSDKPATINLEECIELKDLVAETGRLYALTHPYVAYPLIAEAKWRVACGELGKIRKVIVEYTQGWLTAPVEHSGNVQAAWRTDPAKAGPSGCFGDIGVHAFNLAEYVCGLEVTELSASLNKVVSGRRLDDDGTALLRFANGAVGTLIASQICVGEENNLRLRVYGDAGSLDWQQESPNSLYLRFTDRPTQLLRTGGPGLSAAANRRTRLPAGHPEGYLEAFANIYSEFAEMIRGDSESNSDGLTSVAGIREAIRGMAFIETAVQSSSARGKWLRLPDESDVVSVGELHQG